MNDTTTVDYVGKQVASLPIGTHVRVDLFGTRIELEDRPF